MSLLLDGGSGTFLGNDFDVMGLGKAQQKLQELAASPDPAVAAKAKELANFVRQAKLALANTAPR